MNCLTKFVKTNHPDCRNKTKHFKHGIEPSLLFTAIKVKTIPKLKYNSKLYSKFNPNPNIKITSYTRIIPANADHVLDQELFISCFTLSNRCGLKWAMK